MQIDIKLDSVCQIPVLSHLLTSRAIEEVGVELYGNDIN